MIICSCNVLSDHQVRDAVSNAAPTSPVQVYGCLGCSPRCGRCMRTIKTIMDEGTRICAAGCTGSHQD